MVYRVYVEKKPALANEAKALLSDAKNLLGISALENVRVINCYDAENIDSELFEYAKKTVFSEPQLDMVSDTLEYGNDVTFAVEYLPGQFDQRADSASQCIQIISQGDRPIVHSAKVYVMSGKLTQADVDAIKKYVINPVEAREASMDKPETLKVNYAIPTTVQTMEGFIDLDKAGLSDFVKKIEVAKS